MKSPMTGTGVICSFEALMMPMIIKISGTNDKMLANDPNAGMIENTTGKAMVQRNEKINTPNACSKWNLTKGVRVSRL